MIIILQHPFFNVFFCLYRFLLCFYNNNKEKFREGKRVSQKMIITDHGRNGTVNRWFLGCYRRLLDTIDRTCLEETKVNMNFRHSYRKLRFLHVPHAFNVITILPFYPCPLHWSLTVISNGEEWQGVYWGTLFLLRTKSFIQTTVRVSILYKESKERQSNPDRLT